MAYDASKHSIFSDRCKAFMQNLRQAYREAGDLDDIYIQETASGTDPAWVDTSNATASEHVDALIVMRRLRDALAFDGQSANITSEDQTARFTPWLQ